MPMFDYECPHCGHRIEKFTHDRDLVVPCPNCTCNLEKVLLPSKRTVIGDEMDYIDDNLGPEPVHIRSREQRERLMRERGLSEFVRHVGVPGSDKSPHTSSWAAADKTTLANAAALLERIHPDVPEGVAAIETPDGRRLGLEVRDITITVVPSNVDAYGGFNKE